MRQDKQARLEATAGGKIGALGALGSLGEKGAKRRRAEMEGGDKGEEKPGIKQDDKNRQRLRGHLMQFW